MAEDQTDPSADAAFSSTDGSGPLEFSGLTVGHSYTFTVSAANTVGAGEPSEASAPMLAQAPLVGQPTSVSATRGDGSASVSWTAPDFDGGSAITGYTVTSSSGGKTCETDGAARSCTVSGLENGTPYTFTVVASNAFGSGAVSDASSEVTPAGLPGKASGVSATSGNGSASVSWSAAGANGADVTGYTFTPSGGG